MKRNYLLLFLLILNVNVKAQPLSVNPNILFKNASNTVIFSGGVINITTGTQLNVGIGQGTTIFITGSKTSYNSLTNQLISTFEINSSALSGVFDIIFYYFSGLNIGSIANIYSKSINIDGNPLGIKELTRELFQFDFFPNPIEQGQEINFLQKDYITGQNRVSILNQSGKEVYHKENDTSIDNIQTNFLNKGVYFIHYQDKNSISTTKKLVVE